MKRLNPETNLPFKYGNIRNDGKYFWGYTKNHIMKNGFYFEQWVTKKKFEDLKEKLKLNRNKYKGKYKKNPEKNRQYLQTFYKKAKTRPDYRASLLLNAAKDRCKISNGKVTITKKWILEKIENGFCELTGLPFDLNYFENHRHNPYSPSLDRIDNKNRDYTIENTRVILWGANIALSEFGLDVIKPILEKMINCKNV